MEHGSTVGEAGLDPTGEMFDRHSPAAGIASQEQRLVPPGAATQSSKEPRRHRGRLRR